MKNKITFILLLLVLPFAKAQKDLALDFMFGVGNTFNVKNDLSNSTLTIKDYRFLLGGRFGSNITFQVDEQTAFKSGLRVTATGYKQYWSGVTLGSQHNGNGGWIGSINEGTVITREYWAEIPFIYHHTFKKKRWTPYFDLGITLSTQFMERFNMFAVEIGGERTIIRTGIRPFKIIALGGIASFGIEHNFKKDKTFFVQTSINSNFLDIRQRALTSNKGFLNNSKMLLYETGVRFPL